MFERDSYEDWRGIDVVDDAGSPVGEVVELFLDTETERPEWVAVDVAAASGGPPLVRMIPFSGVSFGEDALVSRWDREQVAGSPLEAPADGISRSDEDRLYRHYGLDYPTHWINAGMPGGAEMVGVAGIVAEGQRPDSTPGRRPDGPASDAVVDEPRRVRRADVADPGVHDAE